MRDNPEGDELDLVVDVRRRCKNSFSILSCMEKRIKESCDRGNEVGSLHSRRDGERPVPIRKPKEFGKRKNLKIEDERHS